MLSEIEIIENLFGKIVENFTKNDTLALMRIFANQFRFVETNCGKRLMFDDTDYNFLRSKSIFYDSNRKMPMTLWFSKEGKRVVAPIAKLIMNAEGRAIIHFKDKNPFNLKRENLELITHQAAHQKQKKCKTMNGEIPSSKYKGVSWNKFAKKWSSKIKINNKSKHLGYFITEEDAAKEYNKAAKKSWGEDYSNLNVI
jgi:hypothetical protein